MAQQPLAARPGPRVPPSVAVATVLLQVLAQGDQRRAQAGPVGRQHAAGQLEEDGGHPGHAVVGGLQRDGPHLEGGVGEAHELREERVGAAEVLVAAVGGGVVVVGGRAARRAAGVVVGVQVVQRQVLPAARAPPAQREVVVVVVVRRGPRARLVLVGDGDGGSGVGRGSSGGGGSDVGGTGANSPGGSSSNRTTLKTYPIKINVKNKHEGSSFDPKVKVFPISEGGQTFSINDVIGNYTAINQDTGKPAENVT